MIVGRKKEQMLLEEIYSSRKAEFVALYGRRRIGKTFLIREFFCKKKCTFFHATGVQKGTMKTQLEKFAQGLGLAFYGTTDLKPASSWREAFHSLHEQITKTKGIVVIFLDELPWLATRKSGLLTELEYYWNRYWSAMPNVRLIICGSSAAWIIQKIINNTGGLHNRITCEMRLLPFDLVQTNEYLKGMGITLTQNQVLELYMALGGIPYYLEYVKRSFTAAQNIEHIYFGENAPLRDEFQKLFGSLFKKADAYIELVTLIAKKRAGINQEELADMATLSKSGGRLGVRLNDLVVAGFIDEYAPWGEGRSKKYYKLIDEFSLFYLYWVAPQKGRKNIDYWLDQSQRPAYHAWAGYTFESICMKHLRPIVSALGIKTGVSIGSWRFIPEKKSDENGAQVDLVIDRSDDAINVCEIKYTQDPFVIDKEYAAKLRNLIQIFKEKTRTKKQLFLSMISAHGIKQNMYAEDMVDGVVTLEDLFKE